MKLKKKAKCEFKIKTIHFDNIFGEFKVEFVENTRIN